MSIVAVFRSIVALKKRWCAQEEQICEVLSSKTGKVDVTGLQCSVEGNIFSLLNVVVGDNFACGEKQLQSLACDKQRKRSCRGRPYALTLDAVKNVIFSLSIPISWLSEEH
jgi:hypothetical protein